MSKIVNCTLHRPTCHWYSNGTTNIYIYLVQYLLTCILVRVNYQELRKGQNTPLRDVYGDRSQQDCHRSACAYSLFPNSHGLSSHIIITRGPGAQKSWQCTRSWRMNCIWQGSCVGRTGPGQVVINAKWKPQQPIQSHLAPEVVFWDDLPIGWPQSSRPQSRPSISIIRGSTREEAQMVMAKNPYPKTSITEHNDAPVHEVQDWGRVWLPDIIALIFQCLN